MSDLRQAAPAQGEHMTKILIDRSTVEQALEALDGVEALLTSMDVTHLLVYEEVNNAITAFKAALAEPQGCDHCSHPLYAATRCRVCGRVTEPTTEDSSAVEPGQEPVVNHYESDLDMVKCRQIAREYAWPNSNIDSGNLYWALHVALRHVAPPSAQQSRCRSPIAPSADAERERNAQIADAHASCEGIAQVIAAEIRGQA